ncbi:hypothetical protein KQ51_00842 [Candidatus Izimaplasma bacterium HR1]|jgi:predicted RNA-binding protein YlxR (DUF448 family)|uniref:RNase P modulator RnpM n=1 Tax=Candidatus Izimoplasma sp. HR1 TaxID=1541959 RepID=UPI0004F77800|nr:hypothetical protein KQ51_00842 [Candidatus Izimaplasma bacterium HR1]
MNPKKVPMRKCIITNERFPKQELIRVVKDKEGNVNVDLTGKLNGRGAYLKKDLNVIKKAIKTRKLDRHLETTIPETIYEELLKTVE